MKDSIKKILELTDGKIIRVILESADGRIINVVGVNHYSDTPPVILDKDNVSYPIANGFAVRGFSNL